MTILERLKRPLAHRRAVLYITLLAVLFTLPSLFVGFATDDHFFRSAFHGFPGLPEFKQSPIETFRFFFESDPAVREARMERGLLPWWIGQHTRIAFMRPFTSVTHWVDYKLFGETAWPMHVHSVLWFALACVLAGLLYRRLMMPAWAAGLAALLYALDDARGLSVGWLSGRNALLTTLFGFLVLLCHDRWRRDHWRVGPYLAVGALSMGLLSGEAALSVGGYLFAYALLVDDAPLLKRFGALMPYAGVVMVWAMVYRHFGFGTHGSEGYADPVGEPLHFVSYVATHLPVLMFTQFGLPDSTVYNFLPAPLAHAYWTVAFLGVCLFAWLLWPVIRAERRARFWALGMILSALPACAVTPQDRLLGYPGLGAMALVAMFIQRVDARADWSALGPRWRKAAVVAAPIALALHLVLSPLLLANGSYMIRFVEEGNLRANASLPKEARVKDDTFVFVNVLGDLTGVGLPVVRSSLGEPVPRHTWMLAATNEEVLVERVDAQSLVVTPKGGYLVKPWANLFRQPSREPMRAGDTVRLSAFEAEVLSASPDGHPQSVKFTFNKPLDDPSLRWFAWQGNHFVPFIVPGIHQRTSIPGANFAQLLGVGSKEQS
jgi:hypothetical protein